MKYNQSTVTIREYQKLETVSITTDDMPEIHSEIITKWQSLIDIAAKIANVPSGLIMKLNEKTIEVFLMSQTEGNPYEVGEEAELIYGLYCETVVGTQKKLLVPDATKSSVWKDNNPDIDLNMISYLGFPINWPNGEVFGTICLLDNKENHYNENYAEMLFHLKQHIDTDLKLLISNQNLAQSNKQLKELNATKDKFFSIIGHDLRESIGGLKSILEVMISGYDLSNTEKLIEILQTTHKSANATFELLENLLLWAKSQMKKIIVNKEKISFNNLVIQTIDSLTELSKNKQIKININIPDNTIVFADKNILMSVLRNLISNAIKFTPNGKQIYIYTDRNKEDYIVAVKDEGVGISPENKAKLFTDTEHLSTYGTNGEKGTGLGLFLCKEFLEKHDGKIWLESQEGFGSTFLFTIPSNNVA